MWPDARKGGRRLEAPEKGAQGERREGVRGIKKSMPPLRPNLRHTTSSFVANGNTRAVCAKNYPTITHVFKSLFLIVILSYYNVIIIAFNYLLAVPVRKRAVNAILNTAVILCFSLVWFYFGSEFDKLSIPRTIRPATTRFSHQG